MKNLLLPVLSFGAILHFQPQASACTQAPRAMIDLAQINIAVSSAAFKQELRQLMQANMQVGVRNIEIDELVKVQMSNDCKIEAKLIYRESDGVGMCPRLDRVEAKTVCPN
jgi:hypothetical protein